ncbi:MAG: hypothetical protein ABIA77_02350 [Candidatus Omnitrophota bacterium]
MRHKWEIIGIIVVIMFLLSGCATCREKAVKDAEKYRAIGRDVRISAYCMGVVGRIIGMGLWSSHVQAQVWDGVEWLWVGEFGGLHKTPTYSTRPMIVSETETYDYIWWSLDDYKSMLLRRDEILRETPQNPCDLFYKKEE